VLQSFSGRAAGTRTDFELPAADCTGGDTGTACIGNEKSGPFPQIWPERKKFQADENMFVMKFICRRILPGTVRAGGLQQCCSRAAARAAMRQFTTPPPFDARWYIIPRWGQRAAPSVIGCSVTLPVRTTRSAQEHGLQDVSASAHLLV
jgi:hypothetical protein